VYFQSTSSIYGCLLTNVAPAALRRTAWPKATAGPAGSSPARRAIFLNSLGNRYAAKSSGRALQPW